MPMAENPSEWSHDHGGRHCLGRLIARRGDGPGPEIAAGCGKYPQEPNEHRWLACWPAHRGRRRARGAGERRGRLVTIRSRASLMSLTPDDPLMHEESAFS